MQYTETVKFAKRGAVTTAMAKQTRKINIRCVCVCEMTLDDSHHATMGRQAHALIQAFLMKEKTILNAKQKENVCRVSRPASATRFKSNLFSFIYIYIKTLAVSTYVCVYAFPRQSDRQSSSSTSSSSSSTQVKQMATYIINKILFLFSI